RRSLAARGQVQCRLHDGVGGCRGRRLADFLDFGSQAAIVVEPLHDAGGRAAVGDGVRTRATELTDARHALTAIHFNQRLRRRAQFRRIVSFSGRSLGRGCLVSQGWRQIAQSTPDPYLNGRLPFGGRRCLMHHERPRHGSRRGRGGQLVGGAPKGFELQPQATSRSLKRTSTLRSSSVSLVGEGSRRTNTSPSVRRSAPSMEGRAAEARCALGPACGGNLASGRFAGDPFSRLIPSEIVTFANATSALHCKIMHADEPSNASQIANAALAGYAGHYSGFAGT